MAISLFQNIVSYVVLFFFQADDGIRAGHVTGVQTCALPISTVELHEGFSEPDATARPWAEVVEVLSRSEMFWLSTVRREGRPHVTPLPAIWLDGTLHFCAGAAEQKAKNL